MTKNLLNFKSKISQIYLLFFCLITGGLLSTFYGPDANWDLQNYHIYNSFQFLHNRLEKDFMAAGMQSYLNPILDLPYYYLSVGWFQDSPKVVAFIAGLPYGLVIFLTLLILNEISLSLENPKKLDVFFAAVFGLTGTIVLSEVGTTFNDIQISVIVLLALLCELKVINNGSYKGISSGVLLGLAAGLKLTSVIFAPAMLIALLITSKSFSFALRGGFLFCFFWGIGFLVSGGFWLYELIKNFGNPIFPLFNSVFNSPWYALGSGRDMRFMPQNWSEAVFYPFYWMSGKPTIAEIPMRDGRYAVAYISIIFYAALYFINKLKPTMITVGSAVVLKNVKVLFIISFFAFTYIVWEVLFSIGRYVISLEVLTGLLFLIGYKLCYTQFGSKLPLRVIIHGGAAIISVVILLTSLPMNWGRLQYKNGFGLANISAYLPENSTVFVVGKPIAFIIPLIDSPGSVYIGLSDGVNELSDFSPPIKMIHSRLKEDRLIFVLTNLDDESINSSLSKISDFVFDSSQCKVLNNNYQSGIKLCPVHLVAA